MEFYLLALLLVLAMILLVRCWRCHEETPLGALPLSNAILPISSVARVVPPSGVVAGFDTLPR